MSAKSMRMPIRTLIGDTRPLVRIGMRLNLERSRNVEVVGETADLTAALALTKDHAPDVIIIGNSFSVQTAEAVAESVLQYFPNTRFVILTDEIPLTDKATQITSFILARGTSWSPLWFKRRSDCNAVSRTHGEKFRDGNTTLNSSQRR